MDFGREEDRLIRPSEAARRLGVCTETIRRWMRKGALPFERVGPNKLQRLRLSHVDAMRQRDDRNDQGHQVCHA